MEGKKLEDDEIITALKKQPPRDTVLWLEKGINATDILALIYRLQGENERLKSHIKAKEIADEHVRKMRGTDLRTIAEQKEEIERYQCVNKLLEGDIEELNKALEKRVEDVYADFMKDYKIMRNELNELYDENEQLKKDIQQKELLRQKAVLYSEEKHVKNAELQKQVDELTEELATYIHKAVFYYNKCKEYGVENFHDEMLEEQFKGKEGNTIQFPQFKGEVE